MPISTFQLDLNEQFQKALEAMQESNGHIFITGKAGTGKSTLLSYFIQNTQKPFAVLAPTGVAALNVKGETIHSFFRFMPNITLEEARKKGKKQQDNKLYQTLTTIIIDEISMVRADLLDCVDVFLRTARMKNKPFGDVKMIFIGDLYQLPPVITNDEKPHFEKVYKSPWFFDAQVLEHPEFSMNFIELEKIYRQKDEAFIDLLNAIRTNTVDHSHLKTVNQRVGVESKEKAIYLTSTNARAREINENRLNELPSKKQTFEGSIRGDFDFKQLPTEMKLELKIGAQVMFVNNDSAGRFVNGTIGEVVGFNQTIDDQTIMVAVEDGSVVEVNKNTWDMYKYFYDPNQKTLSTEEIGSFTQYPLRLAWAITIHKSQGKTFNQVIIDLDRGSFASGQTYVALSRCRTFEGIKLQKSLKLSDIKLDWRVQKFLTNYQYQISEKNISLQEKINFIQKIIDQNKAIEIVYLKAKDIKSRRKIKPTFIGELTYEGKPFLGVEALCLLRNEPRVFRVDRILELREE